MLQVIATGLAVALMGVGCGASGGSEEDSSDDSPTTVETESEPDHALGESNIKYDALDGIVARGAIAPVIEGFRCTWSSDTVADCTGTGYDNAADESQCGYALLPCGNFDVKVHAECADGEGHDCETELELQSSG